jgi:ribonuclease III
MHELEQRLGYQFKNADLLRRALTHPSHGHERRRKEADNQRLEFLGDAVLQLAITESLYARFPDHAEGQLTPLRANLVNRDQMQQLAETLGLGPHLVLGKGEEQNGGRTRGSNLADAMEAVFGALYVDAGWDISREIVQRLLQPYIHSLLTQKQSTNPKGDLQEKLQTAGGEAPSYECCSESGPAHNRRYEVRVTWQEKELGRGVGSSKKEAETNAARAALESFKS